jgi:hypothetical protein
MHVCEDSSMCMDWICLTYFSHKTVLKPGSIFIIKKVRYLLADRTCIHQCSIRIVTMVGSVPSRAMTNLITGSQGRHSALNPLRSIFYIDGRLMNQRIFVVNQITVLVSRKDYFPEPSHFHVKIIWREQVIFPSIVPTIGNGFIDLYEIHRSDTIWCWKCFSVT